MWYAVLAGGCVAYIPYRTFPVPFHHSPQGPGPLVQFASRRQSFVPSPCTTSMVGFPRSPSTLRVKRHEEASGTRSVKSLMPQPCASYFCSPRFHEAAALDSRLCVAQQHTALECEQCRRMHARCDCREAVAEAQWAWLERELAESRADYLWAAGCRCAFSGGSWVGEAGVSFVARADSRGSRSHMLASRRGSISVLRGDDPDPGSLFRVLIATCRWSRANRHVRGPALPWGPSEEGWADGSKGRGGASPRIWRGSTSQCSDLDENWPRRHHWTPQTTEPNSGVQGCPRQRYARPKQVLLRPIPVELFAIPPWARFSPTPVTTRF